LAKILVLHGPNLNLLGVREPDLYGHDTLEQINHRLTEHGAAAGHQVRCFQSNAEHELVDAIQKAMADQVAYIIINPAGFTHTSVVLRDALLATGIPFIEIHMSNIHARESFRRNSYFTDIAKGVILGFGAQGYELAIQAACQSIK